VVVAAAAEATAARTAEVASSLQAVPVQEGGAAALGAQAAMTVVRTATVACWGAGAAAVQQVEGAVPLEAEVARAGAENTPQVALAVTA
jgi:hypothetical protein